MFLLEVLLYSLCVFISSDLLALGGLSLYKITSRSRGTNSSDPGGNVDLIGAVTLVLGDIAAIVFVIICSWSWFMWQSIFVIVIIKFMQYYLILKL